ncbi:MAG: hypothetical protein ACOWYE_10830 [Desulfatiglandales bacterium]
MRDHRKLGAFESADAHPEMGIPGFAVTAFSYQRSGIRYQLSAVRYQLSAISVQLSAFSYLVSAFSYQLAYSLTNLHSSTLMKTSQAGIG